MPAAAATEVARKRRATTEGTRSRPERLRTRAHQLRTRLNAVSISSVILPLPGRRAARRRRFDCCLCVTNGAIGSRANALSIAPIADGTPMVGVDIAVAADSDRAVSVEAHSA